MSDKQFRELETRLSHLEAEVRQLREELAGRGSSEAWWKQVVGSQEGDPVFAEIVRLGRRIRRADREDSKSGKEKKTRRKAAKPQ